MKTNFKQLLICLVMPLALLFSNQVEASQLNFGVKPTIPTFQVDKDKTYFDLKIDQGTEEELEVVLKNTTKKEVTVEISLDRATTNINGIVEYGAGKFTEDDSLVHNIEKIVSIERPEITVKPNAEEKVILKVNMPGEEFPGVLAAGLTFKEKTKEEESQESQGMAIKNEFAYVVALVLHGNVPQKDIPSELLLNKVEAGQVNVRNVIFANLQNPKPKYLNSLAIEAKIYKKGSDKVVYTSENENMQMAPNSNFDYPVRLEGNKLEAGEYTLKLHGTSKKDTWDLEKDFTITREEAKKYNEKDVTIKVDYTWWYVGGVIGALLILQGVFFYIMKKRNKKAKRSKGKSKRTKKRKK